jgi:hypothetical protein
MRCEVFMEVNGLDYEMLEAIEEPATSIFRIE